MNIKYHFFYVTPIIQDYLGYADFVVAIQCGLQGTESDSGISSQMTGRFDLNLAPKYTKTKPFTAYEAISDDKLQQWATQRATEDLWYRQIETDIKRQYDIWVRKN